MVWWHQDVNGLRDVSDGTADRRFAQAVGPSANMEETSTNDLQTSTSVGTTPLASSIEETCGTDPAWYTPARLLMAFCLVSFLVFLDRGIIASNGVNGDKDSRTGIQVT